MEQCETGRNSMNKTLSHRGIIENSGEDNLIVSICYLYGYELIRGIISLVWLVAVVEERNSMGMASDKNKVF